MGLEDGADLVGRHGAQLDAVGEGSVRDVVEVGADQRCLPFGGDVAVVLQPGGLPGGGQPGARVRGVGPEARVVDLGGPHPHVGFLTGDGGIEQRSVQVVGHRRREHDAIANVPALVFEVLEAGPAVSDDVAGAVLEHVDVGLGVAVVEVGVADVELLHGRHLLLAEHHTIRSEDRSHRQMVLPAAIGAGTVRLRQVESVGEVHVDDAIHPRRCRRRGFRPLEVRRPA